MMARTPDLSCIWSPPTSKPSSEIDFFLVEDALGGAADRRRLERGVGRRGGFGLLFGRWGLVGILSAFTVRSSV